MIATAALGIGLLVGLSLSAFFSGVETGVYCLNRVRIRVAAERGNRGAAVLVRLMERTEDLVITALLGTNIADYLATACVTALLLRAFSSGPAELYATLIMTPMVLVFGGILPKDAFRRNADAMMMRSAYVLLGAARLLRATGMVWFLRALSRNLLRRIDPDRVAEPEQVLPRMRTLQLLEEGAAHGGLTPYQRDVMRRILRLSQVRVASVMIPRARAAIIPIDMTRDDFMRIARMAHFARMAVYSNDPSAIVGIVSVFDVLTDPENRPPRAHIRSAVRLPDQLSVTAALLRIQDAREKMAVVENRAGQCVGILTVKDLVEELVGDLEAW